MIEGEGDVTTEDLKNCGSIYFNPPQFRNLTITSQLSKASSYFQEGIDLDLAENKP